ncbi:hypothetical protein EAF04_007117 [Stromatinia cepivora]|nr:hypothetical protein EAF04_007117 [Stromatinia cepivora]
MHAHLPNGFDGQCPRPEMPAVHQLAGSLVSPQSSESEPTASPATPATPRSAHGDAPDATADSKLAFERILLETWNAKSHEQMARWERNRRFGMKYDEAGRRTPERMREEYNEIVERELLGDRTPSPITAFTPITVREM